MALTRKNKNGRGAKKRLVRNKKTNKQKQPQNTKSELEQMPLVIVGVTAFQSNLISVSDVVVSLLRDQIYFMVLTYLKFEP